MGLKNHALKKHWHINCYEWWLFLSNGILTISVNLLWQRTAYSILMPLLCRSLSVQTFFWSRPGIGLWVMVWCVVKSLLRSWRWVPPTVTPQLVWFCWRLRSSRNRPSCRLSLFQGLSWILVEVLSWVTHPSQGRCTREKGAQKSPQVSSTGHQRSCWQEACRNRSEKIKRLLNHSLKIHAFLNWK